MIKLQKITIKNFESVGTEEVVYEFKNGLTRIMGKNGTGKSTVFSALYYALTGESYKKVKLSSLINKRLKKGLYTELFFANEKDSFRVIRGIKPDIFEIYKNDFSAPLVHDSKTKTYQQILYEIIDCDKKLLEQIMFKSKTKFQSFLSLTKEEKRQFIDKALQTSVLSKMRASLVAEISELESDIEIKEAEQRGKKQLILNEETHIQQLIEVKTKNNDEKITEYENNISNYQKEIDKKAKELEPFAESIAKGVKLKELKDKIEKGISSFDSKKRTLENEITIALKKTEIFRIKCGDCPKIKEFEADDNIDDKKSQIVKLKTDTDDLNKKLKLCIQKINENNSFLQNKILIESDISRYKRMIADDNLRLNALKKKSTEITEEVDYQKLEAYKTELTAIQKTINEKTCDYNDWKTLNNILLKDNGLRSYLVRKYLDFVNERLNYYLSKFKIDLLFLFDENFDEVIAGNFVQGLEFNNLSEGEKKRIDLSILLAFFDLDFSLAGQKFNFILFDETLSGIDVDSIPLLMEVLEEKKDKFEISIIEHQSISNSYFDRIFETNKNDKFTKLLRVE